MKSKEKRASAISRREFLGIAWATSLIGLVTQAGVALFKFFKPLIEPGSFGGKIIAGQVEEFQPGTVSHVQKGRLFISRLEDGSLLALWHRCPHLGCTVPWRQEEGRFHCPCHSSIFNSVGEVVSGPAPRPMDIFPLEIKEGQIVVDTGKPKQRDHFEPSQAVRV